GDVLGRQGRNEHAGRQRLGGVRRDRRLPAAEFEGGCRHAACRELDGDVRAGGFAERSKQAHSTNVTLLISRRVVIPSMTRSTAHSRRKRMPSSRAAFLIS